MFHPCWLARKDRRFIVQLQELCVLHIYIVSAWQNVSIHRPEGLLGNLAISVVGNATTSIAAIFWDCFLHIGHGVSLLGTATIHKMTFFLISKYKIIFYWMKWRV